MNNDRVHKPGYRARVVYSTALKIGLRYLWLYLLGKIRGKAWYDKKISALHRHSAERIKETILELNGLLIKLGQMMSNLSGAIPDEYVEVLESLQDKVPPRPVARIRETIQSELHKTTAELFRGFDEVPLAAASIGQVHRATLLDGRQVAVKVQHADIETIASADLDIIENVIRVVARVVRVRGIDYVYTQVRQMIREELDFTREAATMQAIGKNLANEKGVSVPEVFEAYSSPKILTTAFKEGVKASNIAQIEAWGIDRSELAQRLIHAYCTMVFVDGHYHADPHPGNIIVQPDGELVLLDFGAAGMLSKSTKEAIPELIQAVLKKDTEKVVAAMRKIGFIAKGKDAEEVAHNLMEELTDFFTSEIGIENLNFKDVNFMEIKMAGMERLGDVLDFRKMTRSFQVPKEWVLLQRSIALIYGTCAQLAPDVNPLDEIKPFLRDMVMSRSGIQKLIKDTFSQQFTTLLSLPGDVSRVLQKVNNGELRINLRDLSSVALLFYRLGQQFLFVICGLSGLFFLDAALEKQDEKRIYGSAFFVGFSLLAFLYSFWRGRKIVKTKMRN